MKYTVEQTFSNLNRELLGWEYQNFDDMLRKLIYQMRDEIGHPFVGNTRRYRLRFIMNLPLYQEFQKACQMSGHVSDVYRGIHITPDSSLRISYLQSPYGIVRLIYEESPLYYEKYCANYAKATYEFMTAIINSPSAKPHIDHVKFNGPAL